MGSLNGSFSSSSETFHLPSYLCTPPGGNNSLTDEDVTSQMVHKVPNMEMHCHDGVQIGGQGVNEVGPSLCRKERLLKVDALKQTCRLYCCGRNCLRKLGYNKIKQERATFLSLR